MYVADPRARTPPRKNRTRFRGVDNTHNLRAALGIEADGMPRLTFVDHRGTVKRQGP
jgi:hypothetical protein